MSKTPKDRELELIQIGGCGSSYEIVVRFTRDFEEDLHCGGEELAKDQPIGQALLRQFVAELQSAYDHEDVGMAGSFDIVSGPSVSLGHHQGGKYYPIKAQQLSNYRYVASLTDGQVLAFFSEGEIDQIAESEGREYGIAEIRFQLLTDLNTGDRQRPES